MSISEDVAAGGPSDADSGPTSQVLGVHRFVRPTSTLKLQLLTVVSAVVVATSISALLWLDHTAAAGVVAVVIGLGAATWVAWFGQPTSCVRVEYGALVVGLGAREQRVDIAGADLSVSSSRGWRATFRQVGQRPLVVDAAMVDPGEFTQVLARWRPDIRPVRRDSRPAPRGRDDAGDGSAAR